jgi:murein DD-endopeptidase MepM/ murein hydrolase activator NlpD
VRLALAGIAVAVVGLLVLPAAGPRGTVLHIEGDLPAANAIAQAPPSPSTDATAEPGPAVAASPVASATPAPNVSPGPGRIAGPTPAVSPAPASPTLGATEHGRPPNRLAAELAGTKAPSLDLLTGYRWPVSKVRLTLPFGPTPWGSRLVGGESFHDGIDLATFCGDRVTAAHDGVVLAAGRRYDDVMGWVGDLGPYLRRLDAKRLWMTLPIVVVTDDGNGYRSIYAHFGRVVVAKGDRVTAGQLLGYEGATGRASGCHVHYGLFSPWETDTFRIRPDVVKRMKVPKLEIARVDPLLVLPPKPGVNAPKVPKASPVP